MCLTLTFKKSSSIWDPKLVGVGARRLVVVIWISALAQTDAYELHGHVSFLPCAVNRLGAPEVIFEGFPLRN